MDESREAIRAWTLMDELVLDVYAMTRRFPPDTSHDLASLLRSGAMRGALRIVQGLNGNQEDLPACLRAALRVLAELRYHLYLSRRLGLIDLKQYRAACGRHERVQRCVREWLGHGPHDGASRAFSDSGREGALPDLESSFAALESEPLGAGEG